MRPEANDGTMLEHRRRVEDLAQQRLAKLLRERMVFDNQLQAIEQAVRDDRMSVIGAMGGVISGETLVRHAAYTSQSAARSRLLRDRVQSLGPRIGEARRHLAEAIKQRKAIEQIISTKIHQRHISHQKRCDHDMDDLLVLAHQEV